MHRVPEPVLFRIIWSSVPDIDPACVSTSCEWNRCNHECIIKAGCGSMHNRSKQSIARWWIVMISCKPLFCCCGFLSDYFFFIITDPATILGTKCSGSKPVYFSQSALNDPKSDGRTRAEHFPVWRKRGESYDLGKCKLCFSCSKLI